MKRKSVQLSYLVLINQNIWRYGPATFTALLEKLCRLLCSFTAIIVFGVQYVPSCLAPLLLHSVQQQIKTKFGNIAFFLFCKKSRLGTKRLLKRQCFATNFCKKEFCSSNEMSFKGTYVRSSTA